MSILDIDIVRVASVALFGGVILVALESQAILPAKDRKKRKKLCLTSLTMDRLTKTPRSHL